MILKKKIPKEFYKLFRTKNRDAYMQFLVAIYEENNEVYTALGLTIEECRVIIADTIAKARIIWEDEEIEEEDEPDTLFPEDSPSGILNTLIRWGWLKSDFDEKLNTGGSAGAAEVSGISISSCCQPSSQLYFPRSTS